MVYGIKCGKTLHSDGLWCKVLVQHIQALASEIPTPPLSSMKMSGNFQNIFIPHQGGILKWSNQHNHF